MTSSIPPRLADGIGIARFDHFVIVLDIHRDRYTRVRDKAAQMLAAIHSGAVIDPHDPLVTVLEKNGLVTRRAPCPVARFEASQFHPAKASALEGGDPAHTIGPRDMGIVFECAATRWALRRRTLSRVLLGLPPHRHGRSNGDISMLAHTFDRGRRLAPFTPCCLPDALAFVRYARRHGHPADLVFGVKYYPFEAHCWAQSGGLVLTDPLERVRRFQPILAV